MKFCPGQTACKKPKLQEVLSGQIVQMVVVVVVMVVVCAYSFCTL